jgi:hypothetical protein
MAPEFVMVSLMMTGLVITLVVLFSRSRKQQLAHEERMAALEKGVAVPPIEPQRPWSTRVYLLRGLIWSFCGAAVIVCLVALAAASHRPKSASELAFEAKQLSSMADISREEAKQLVEKDAGLHDKELPTGVALIGLIPLAVGLAYLVFYYTDDSRRRPGGETGLHGSATHPEV